MDQLFTDVIKRSAKCDIYLHMDSLIFRTPQTYCSVSPCSCNTCN